MKIRSFSALLVSAAGVVLWHPHHGRADVKPQLIYPFSAGIADFAGSVIIGPDGNYYGLSSEGGQFGLGTYFRVTPAGTITLLASFGDPNSSARGKSPEGQLVYDGSQYFYGVTDRGGRYDDGTIFRATTAGVVETLVDFSGYSGTAPGSDHGAGLARGSDGNFYGVTDGGGTTGEGVVYRVSALGRYQVLAEFTGASGAFPGGGSESPLLGLPDGSLIGTAQYGGKANAGVIFQVLPDGTCQTVVQFTGPTGAFPGSNPIGNLLRGSDGTVYGRYTNPEGYPALWRMLSGQNPTPAFATLNVDAASGAIQYLDYGLTILESGDIIGMAYSMDAYFGQPGLFKVNAAGQVSAFADLSAITTTYFARGPFTQNLIGDGAGGIIGVLNGRLFHAPVSGTPTVIASPQPDNGTGLGVSPSEPVLVAADSTVYGRAARGGSKGTGTVFKIPGAGGPVSVLHEPNAFTGNQSDPLTFRGANVLFVESDGGSQFSGSVLSFNPAGGETQVAEFPLGADYVSYPTGGLTPGGGGNFYGRAQKFDSNTGDQFDVIYRLTPGNLLESVAVLPAISSFGYTSGPLTFDGANTLYGVQDYNPTGGKGAIYKVGLNGSSSKLVEFGSRSDDTKPTYPQAPLLLEPSGNFLVAMNSGGPNHSGAIIRLTPSGQVQKFIDFTGLEGSTLGDYPLAPLVRDATGALFGVTEYGGIKDQGVIYRIDSAGKYDVLYEFQTGASAVDLGVRPQAGLTLGGDGYIYGTTRIGGAGGGGTVFRFARTPQATGSTQAAANITANSVTLNASLTSNGYGGEIWFSYGEGGTLDRETAHQSIAGFTDAQNFSIDVTGLKGHRTYSFQLHASIGLGGSTVPVTGSTLTFVTPNGAPVAQNDSIIVSPAAGGSFTGDVLANDGDPDGDPLTILNNFVQPSHGTVALVDGKFVYTPDSSFAGEDSFTYTVQDDQNPALAATATVNVVSDGSIAGEYAGLLFEAPAGAVNIPPDGAGITADQIAAGFASFALSKNKKFSARFEMSGRTVPVKGTMAADRDTEMNTKIGKDRFTGSFRPTVGGAEGRVTFNGRTLIFRVGQAFAAGAAPVQLPKSDFTMRFTPDDVANPVANAGIPAGDGFAVIRRQSSARATLVGVLPDGTAFSRKSVIDKNGAMPFLALLYKGKTGSLEGRVTVDTANSGQIDNDANVKTVWKKAPLAKDTRFPTGFSTSMTVFGGKFALPAKAAPPITLNGGKLKVTFDRGGLFAPLVTQFAASGSKFTPVAGADDAHATIKLDGRTGFVSGALKPGKTPIKYRGVVVQRDQTCAGYFLGAGDTGSVEATVIP